MKPIHPNSTRTKNTDRRPRRRRRTGTLWIAGAILLFIVIGIVILERAPQFHPYIVFQSTETISVTYLKRGDPTRGQCEATVKRMAQAITATCSTCRLLENRCLDKLDSRQRKILYGQPVDVPVMRIPGGAAAFMAATPELAMFACEESARQTERSLPGSTQCASAAVESLALSLSNVSGKPNAIAMPKFNVLLGITLLAAAIAFLVCYVIIHTERAHSRFSRDDTKGGPQKFHATPTARVGGLALASALGGSVLVIRELEWLTPTAAGGLYMLTLAALPAFAGGLGEDITKRIGVLARLMLTALAGVIASVLVGATLDRVDIPGFDILLQWPIFAIAFTAFAISGVANAINIIDGYHGLVGGYALLVLAALAYVAMQVGDPVVLTASLAMAGALLGFLFWNYPRGKIFLGDGGAYLLGFWLAELSVLLVARNADVSPWFPLLLLAYPVLECLFAIYRKKILRGVSPGQPDALNLFQLIYLRLVRVFVGSHDSVMKTRRNGIVAGYIWIITAIFCILPALLFWQKTAWLAGFTLIFCTWYFWLFRSIAHWRSPKWMIRKSPKLLVRYS